MSGIIHLTERTNENKVALFYQIMEIINTLETDRIKKEIVFSLGNFVISLKITCWNLSVLKVYLFYMRSAFIY